MEARVSLLSLFVDDIPAAQAFYREAFGWEPGDGGDGITFYQLRGLVLGLITPEAWAQEETGWPPQRGYLAINVSSPAEVDAAIAKALSAGATVTVAPHKALWGGYTGYVEDPWGNLWEFAHNPFWTISDDGATLLKPLV